MNTMPKYYPTEFREDVVRVARSRTKGTTIEQIAADFGVHSMTLEEVAAPRRHRRGCEAWPLQDRVD
jgi:transposase-like protein